MRTYLFFFYICFVGFGESLHAQVPANDLCAGALILTVEGSSFADPIVVNTTDATRSIDRGTNCGPMDSGDLWYKAEVPTDGNIFFEARAQSGSAAFTTQIELFSRCGQRTFDCADAEFFPNDPGLMIFEGLTPGDTAYFRLFSDNFLANTPNEGPFLLDAYMTQLVSNANCMTPEILPVFNPGMGGLESFDLGPSATYEIPCTGEVRNTEWFTMTMPNNFRTLTIEQGQANAFITVLDACDGEVLACGQERFLSLTPATGTTVRMAVSWPSGTTSFTSLYASVSNQHPPNNNPSGAIVLAMDTVCRSRTRQMGFASLSANAESCDPNENAVQDVFFETSSPNSSLNVLFEPTTDTVDYDIEIYRESDGEVIMCANTGGIPIDTSFADITPQTPYLIRVISNKIRSAQSYQLCAWYDAEVSSTKSVDLPSTRLFPNPANNHITIQAAPSAKHYRLRSLLGQLVQEGELVTGRAQVDVSNIASGLFIVEVDGHQTELLKVR